jgi:hypothetical protein
VVGEVTVATAVLVTVTWEKKHTHKTLPQPLNHMHTPHTVRGKHGRFCFSWEISRDKGLTDTTQTEWSANLA